MTTADHHSPIASVFERGRRLTYLRGSMILRAGDIPSGVYWIDSGYVRAYSLSQDGTETICSLHRPGDMFPVPWALNRTLSDVYYEAHEDTQLWRLDRDEFLAELVSPSSFSLHISQWLAQSLQSLSRDISQLSYRSAYDKVVYRLLALTQTAGRQRVQQVVLQVHVSHDFIAHSTSMSRETASRVLSKLARQRLIRRLDGRIVIPDIERLKQAASFDSIQ